MLASKHPITIGELTESNWCTYEFPSHEVAMGFGKKLLETVFVIARR